MMSQPQFYRSTSSLARLWSHECSRVYGDRLMTDKDMETFAQKRDEVIKAQFTDVEMDMVLAEPNLYCSWCSGEDVRNYLPVKDFATLKKILEESLKEYNESNPNMELVLFEMFMAHVVRISRIIEKPRGNCMLVGVGGSGKQSLTKLTSFIVGSTNFGIQLTASYNVGNLKEDMLNLYIRAGSKEESIVWMLTDSQIVDEDFLVYVNDFLSSGFIPDLFDVETKSDMINAVRNAVKAEGIVDTNDNCWDFFLDQVRKNLHLVFCMSPVGENFRVWCRKFPALINCSAIDWVHSWPEEALISVANRFIADIDFGESDDIREKIGLHMAKVHTTTVKMCQDYVAAERRYNYATPKSYLEFIDLYKGLLISKRNKVEEDFSVLEIGLQKLMQTEEDVGQLKVRLEEETVFVAEKTVSVEKLLVNVGAETEVVNEQRAIAKVENEKADVERAAASKVQAECDVELKKAEPLVEQALGALKTLSKEAIQELKGFNNPPAGITEVCSCVLYLISPEGKVAKDVSFKATKKAMNDPAKFVDQLLEMDIDNIPRANIQKVKSLIQQHDLGEEGANNPDVISGRSFAAGGLSKWVVNIVKYDDCYQMITPLRNDLAAAKAKLEAAENTVAVITAKVNDLEASLKRLTDQFESATAEKNQLVENSELTEKKLVMAERLVTGLADEKVRWSANIKTMKAAAVMLIGDSLAASAFVSYIGAFSAFFRQELVENVWLPDLRSKEIPASEHINILDLLSSVVDRANWQNEGLPADQLSLENAAIMTNCARWPLMIDPQLQGLTWIRSREGENDLKVITQGGRFLDAVERAISMGNPLVIENLPESIEPVLEPVLARSTVKRGGQMFIKIGDKDDVEYDKNFKLYLQTKMPSPHYQPEIAAQTTLINFTVTEKGLEDQLLAVVVQHERPDLEKRINDIVRQSNEFVKTLKELEEGLLFNLSNAEGNLIENIELIESLEQTKITSNEVQAAQKESKIAEIEISKSREVYRPSAARASLIYFVLNQLWIVDHMYQYSLAGFMRVFTKAIDRAEASEELQERVKNVTDNVTYSIFCYASRGLFSRHKLVFASQLCFRIMAHAGDLNEPSFRWLLICPKNRSEKPPELDWMQDGSWWAANTLTKVEGFDNLANDLVTSSKRFKEWCDLEAPEREKLPLEYKNLPPLERLCVVRALRPDRMTMATEAFVELYMGKRYVSDVSSSLSNCYTETDPATPVYYILSPGVDVVGEVEKVGKSKGFTEKDGNFSDVSLGEGKDVIADKEVDRLAKDGGWVVLQNVHLMPRWLIELEKRIERNASEAHPDFRLFITSDPSKTIPVALLQRSIKLTQEPPPGLQALFKRSWDCFDDLTWDASSKMGEMKMTVFCLSFFHSIMVERIKFGPQGWNRKYPFNLGDLVVCKDVLNNYLENSGTNIPWEDLKYIFGEIMYGGHITDDFDRLLCSTYLNKFMCNDLFEGLELYPSIGATPGLSIPSSLGHAKMMEYIEENMRVESPVMFGLHPNTEIEFRTKQSEALYNTVAELQPKGASAGGGGQSTDERVGALMEEIQDKLADGLVDMEELVSRIDSEGGRTPHVNVFYQECQYMNILIREIKKSLEVLELGLRGELQMSEAMEDLMLSLNMNRVPSSWAKLAFQSMRPLAGWFDNLIMRIRQLQDWVVDLTLPRVVWISGFFNPQSFLTAIMQQQARKNEWALDKVVVATEVLKKEPEEVEVASKEGNFVHGLSMEGARWDPSMGSVASSVPKEMFFEMPVMLVKAIPTEKADFKDDFLCPVYKTQTRGHTFVWKANLKTKQPASTWIMGGVGMLMDVVK